MGRIHFANEWASGGARTDPGASKIDTGWVAEKPPYQYFNWLDGRQDEMLGYLERRGISAWNTNTSYETGGLCVGSNLLIYQCLTPHSGVDPVPTVLPPTYITANWRLVAPPATEAVSGVTEIATQGETDAGSDDFRFVTPAKFAGRQATETLTGIIELATAAEGQALVDALRAITPAVLAQILATTSAFGISRLATAAEVITGTATDRVVTPQSIGSLNQSMTEPGYKTFPGGMLLQWGQDNVNKTIAQDVALPLAFPTNQFVALSSSALDSANEQDNDSGAKPHPTNPLTEVRLSSAKANRLVSWLCIGN